MRLSTFLKSKAICLPEKAEAKTAKDRLSSEDHVVCLKEEITGTHLTQIGE